MSYLLIGFQGQYGAASESTIVTLEPIPQQTKKKKQEKETCLLLCSINITYLASKSAEEAQNLTWAFD